KSKSPSFFSRIKWVLIWLMVFAAIAAAVFMTRKDLDWQVQHINDLKTKVAQLNQAQQALEARVESQLKETEQRVLAQVESEIQAKINQSVQSNVNQALAQPEHQAIVTQVDIDKIEQATQQQLSQLQQQLSALGEQAIQQVQPILSSASALTETTKQALQPTPETEKALADIEQKLQAQFAQVSNKLVELFEFKSEQQARPSQTDSAETRSLEQLQRWVIEVNTQWLLRGNVAETRTQLTALQQAVAVSQIPNVSQLASFIGKDMAYLEHYQAQQQAHSQLNTNALKQAIQALNRTEGLEAVRGGEKISNDVETTTDVTFDSAIEQLKQTLSSMVSIKKRDSEAETTQVESLILQDVLVQRALLLVDRIEWAMTSQSNPQLKQAVEDLQSYIDRTFSKESEQFKTLLSPFASHSFDVRQPLAIRSWLANQ
ncbi:MAG: hypothetical protein L3J38_07325, partial [Thiomicrorhabdus sp.]|nr:hypothetical protein [Thiomicrorhabdus sp.]